MTISLSLLQRAKQGDAVAIAVLMNDVLQVQDVWAKATLDGNCLQVMLKAPTVLHQSHCIAFIRRGLLRLQPEAIDRVRAYAWRVGDAFPLWIADFSLEQSPLPQSRLNGQSNAVRVLQDCSRRQYSKIAVSEPTLQPPVPLPTLPSHASRQPSELVKLGVVIVLATVVYFIVTGV